VRLSKTNGAVQSIIADGGCAEEPPEWADFIRVAGRRRRFPLDAPHMFLKIL